MRRRNNSFYLILVIVVLLCVTVGYAAMNKILTINGNSEVKSNTWDLHFENVKISEGSVEADTPPTINNNNLSVNFDFAIDFVGDFYEFTVDVVNDGTIDAMIDSISKTPELTAEQAKYISYVIEYQNGESINTKQLVGIGSFVRIKVRVESIGEIPESASDVSSANLNLGFILNYTQSDSTSVEVNNNGSFAPRANGDINDIGTIVTVGPEKFYTIGVEGDNVKLLSMYNLKLGYECPADASSFEQCTSYGDEATGMQDEDMIGFDSTDNVYRGITPFTTEDLIPYGGWPSDYVGSLVEDYVYEYKDKLKNKYDLNVVDATILSKNDLTNAQTFACSATSPFCQNTTYTWIYSTAYWMKDPYYGSDLYLVKQNGDIGTSFFSKVGYGVRPVIIIPKSYFE